MVLGRWQSETPPPYRAAITTPLPGGRKEVFNKDTPTPIQCRKEGQRCIPGGSGQEDPLVCRYSLRSLGPALCIHGRGTEAGLPLYALTEGQWDVRDVGDRVPTQTGLTLGGW